MIRLFYNFGVLAGFMIYILIMLTEGSEEMYARSVTVTVVSSGILSFHSALYKVFFYVLFHRPYIRTFRR